MASLPSASNSTAASKWAPFSGPGNFASNMIILLILLFCSLVLIIALNAIIRHLLCSLRRRHSRGSLPSDIEHATSNGAKILSASSSSSSPSLTFSATTKLAGAAAECSICLAEFADGDQVRVLPACNHGFHVGCVEKWLVSSKSCPTCRANCHVAGV